MIGHGSDGTNQFLSGFRGFRGSDVGDVRESEDLLVFPNSSVGKWFVLHTKPRQEKILASDLKDKNIAYFLPLQRMLRFYGARRAWVDLPLFPSYLFLRGTIEQAYAADRSRRLVSFIPVPDQEELDGELLNLHLALVHHVPLEAYPFLKVGCRVEVSSGPLRGMRGVVESRGQNSKLILRVKMLGQALCLQVHGSLLEPLD